MARKKYLELKGMRAHYNADTEQVVITSTSLPLNRAGFKVPLAKNTRSELAVKHLLRKERMLPGDDPLVDVAWTDENCIAIAGRQGIGKTAFAAILASALVDIGKKTLLVETIGDDGQIARYAHRERNQKAVEDFQGLEIITTAHGWDALVIPHEDGGLERMRREPELIRDYMAKLKKKYDVIIFDTSEAFLTCCEYSPFIRYFSNILLLSHPYGENKEAIDLVNRLPRSIAIHTLSSAPDWETNKHRESLKMFGWWGHMQDFYKLDNDSLLSRGEPLYHMHNAILPSLPLAFRP